MAFLVQGQAVIDDSASPPITQYLMVERGIATLWRKGTHISVPVEGIGQLYGIASGLNNLESAPLSVEVTIRAILGFYENSDKKALKLQIGDFILDAHRKLQRKAEKEGLPPLGSSMSMVWLIDKNCYWANIGNGRIYLLRNGELKQLSSDHNHSEFAKRHALQTPTEPNALAQAFLLGQEYPIKSKSLRMDLGLDIMNFKLAAGDCLFLCSASLHTSLDDSQIKAALETKPESASAHLLQMVEQNNFPGNIGALTIVIRE